MTKLRRHHRSHTLLRKNRNSHRCQWRGDSRRFPQRLESTRSLWNTVRDGSVGRFDRLNGFLELFSLLQSPLEHLTPTIRSNSNTVLSHRFVYRRGVPFQIDWKATHIITTPPSHHGYCSPMYMIKSTIDIISDCHSRKGICFLNDHFSP